MGWADDCEAIRQTISLYCQLLDDQRYEELGQLFAPDAVLFWEGTTTTGREQIVTDLPGTQLPLGSSRHLPYGPVMRVDGDSAAVWTDVMVTVHPPDAPAFPGWVGRYHQRFSRIDGRWLIAAHIALGIGDTAPDGVEIVDSRALG
ncbi:MAG: nuclear transport factor 2 family protein [Acidimicrobiia bacterium]